MKTLFALLLTMLSLAAQTIHLKNGQSIDATSLRRDGQMVMAKLAIGPAGSGEIGHPVAAIASIDFPEPPELGRARVLASEGRSAEALTTIEPVVVQTAPFRDIPGNWWMQATIQKVSSLIDLERLAEANTLLAAIPANSADPKLTESLDLRRAEVLTRKGETSAASEIYDRLIAASKNPAAIAEAWIGRGTIHLASDAHEEALLAFLRVPVIFQSQTAFLPPALLGGVRAAAAAGDETQAADLLNDLLTRFPKSREATTARSEFSKLIPTEEKTPAS